MKRLGVKVEEWPGEWLAFRDQSGTTNPDGMFLLAILPRFLNWRAGYIPVWTEHTTISSLGSQRCLAALAFVNHLAGINWHGLSFFTSTFRTRNCWRQVRVTGGSHHLIDLPELASYRTVFEKFEGDPFWDKIVVQGSKTRPRAWSACPFGGIVLAAIFFNKLQPIA